MSNAFLLGVPAKLKTLIDRLTVTRAANLENLDATVSSRLAAAGYTAPDNATIVAIAAYVDELETRLTATRAGKIDYLDKAISAINGGLKTVNPGPFCIPSLAVVVIATKSTSANTYGSYVQLIGATAAALYIVGISLGNYDNQEEYNQVELAIGAGGAEVPIGTFQVGRTGNGITTDESGIYIPIFPPIPVAASTRIAARYAGSSTAANEVNLALACIAQPNIVAM